MISQLTMQPAHLEEMLRHVSQQAPLEACGLLAGTQSQVQQVIVVRNQAQSPVRFVMDPYEQLQAFQRIEAQGFDLVGIFHSHPAGPETVSATDIAESAYEVAQLVWSRSSGTWQARGFWIERGQATEIRLLLRE